MEGWAGQSKDADEDQYVVEEEITNIPGWTPSVSLEVKDSVETGEECEEELYSQRSKLYRFKDSEWKERGVGEAKLLRHRENGKVRFMLRQEKTMKIVANHLVIDHAPYCDLKPNAGSEKCWVWSAQDYAEEEHQNTQFALKFGTVELAQSFKEHFDRAKQLNSQLQEYSDLANSGPGDEDSTASSQASAPVAPPAAKAAEADAASALGSEPAAAQASTIASALPKSSAPPPGGLFGTASGSTGSLFAPTSSSSAGGLFAPGSRSGMTGGLFGSPSGTSGGLFSTASASTGSLFAPTSGSSTGGLFAPTSGSSMSSLFAPTSGNGTGSLFAPASSPATSGGLFGSPPATSGGLFGTASSSTGSLFPPTSGSSMSGLFASASSSGTTGGLFGSPGTSGGLFAQNTMGSTGGQPQADLQPGSQQPQAATDQDDEQYVVEEEITNIPGWAPSVTLEVKDRIENGEEDEEELYSQRSKLYRFRDGDWKERGVGEAKLLQHKENKKVRFMLRQEKTMKIVANHYVIDCAPYCDLQPNAGSEKCWVWSASDCSDEEPVVQRFALKFGNSDLATKFKSEFNRAKELNSQISGLLDTAGAGEKTGSDGATRDEPAKPDEDKGGSEVHVPPPPAQKSSESKDGPQVVKPPEPSEANPFANVSLFGSNSHATSNMLFSSNPMLAATGSQSASNMLFSSSPMLAATGPAQGLFGNAFEATAGQKPPAEPQADQPKGQDQDDDHYEEEEVTNIPGWAPSVTLEVKETVETGEEEEEELYSQRSKLYRFRDNEWKERGLGEAKLLKHRETGKVRFMLRQEKTMKIVANHYVIDHTPYCDLQPNAGNEKCWVWLAQDCADGECQVERLALKFGFPELATKFKEAFDHAKELNSELESFKELVSNGQHEEGSANTQRDAPETAPHAPEQRSCEGGHTSNDHACSPQVPKPSDEKQPPSWESVASKITFPAVSSSAPSAGLTSGAGTPANPFSGTSVGSSAPEVAGGLPGTSPGTSSGLFGSLGEKPSLFSGLSTGTPSTGCLFGSLSGAPTGLFGSSSSSPPGASGSVFGSSSSSLARGSVGLFGSPSSGPSATSTGLFGNSSSSLPGTSVSLFGSSSTSLSGTPASLFAPSSTSFTATSASSLFGSSSSFAGTSVNLFGSASSSPPGSSASLFGSSSSSSPAGTSVSLFGSSSSSSSPGTSTSSLFGGASAGFVSFSASSGFGSGASSLFGASSSTGLFGSMACTPAGKQQPACTPPSQASSSGWGGTWSAPCCPSGEAGPAAAPQQAEDDEYVPEEEVTTVPGWTPSLTLKTLECVETGEEDEEELFSQRSKLYRFRDGDWKERGTGDVKILRHRVTGKVRFLLRQEKTMKVVANHCIVDQPPYCDLRPNAGSAKCWVWTAVDCADGEQVVEKFALKLRTAELATKFSEAFEQAKGLAEAPTPSVAANGPACTSKDAGAGEPDEGEPPDEVEPEEQEWEWTPEANAPNVWQQAAAATGWRCDSCRLQWPDEAIECGVCEIPRPGFEDYVAEQRVDKEKERQNVVAAFLGGGGGGGGQQDPAGPSPSGFGAPAASPPSIFGAPAGPSTLVGFGAPPPPAGAGGQAPKAPQFAFGPPAPAPLIPTPVLVGAAASKTAFPVASPVVSSGIGATTVASSSFNPLCGGNPTNTINHDVHGSKPDAAFVSTVVEAVKAAVARNSSAAAVPHVVAPPAAESRKYDDQIRRLEDKVHALEERCDRAEERARKAEERARRTEGELDDAKQQIAQLRRKQQEDSEDTRRLLKHQAEDDKRALESVANEVRQEKELRCSMEKELRSSMESELRREKEMRSSMETSSSAASEAIQNVLSFAGSALKIAEGTQQSVMQLREETKQDLSSINTAVDAIQRTTKERLEALELKLDNTSLDDLRTMSVPNRIMYLQRAVETDKSPADTAGVGRGGSRPLLQPRSAGR